MKSRDPGRPVLTWKSSGIIWLMFQLRMVTRVACRQGQGGTRGRENEVGGGGEAERERSGLPFRHPNKSGLFFCAARVQPTLSEAASGIRNSLSSLDSLSLLQGCTDSTSVIELQWMIQWKLCFLDSGHR